MLREKLKQDLDKLNEEQLKKIAVFIAFVEFQSKQVGSSVLFGQRATTAERAFFAFDEIQSRQVESSVPFLQTFLDFVEIQSRQVESSVPFWQRATTAERTRELREWVSQLPKNSPSLPDEAFSRDSIYEE